MSARPVGPTAPVHALEYALERIADRALRFDRGPRFPQENFADLFATGALGAAAENPGYLPAEIALVRAVAAVDASTARILDGHLNGVERLARGADTQLLGRELNAIRDGRLLLGVWGADPAPGEGPPAQLFGQNGQLRLRGVKTFCSGAGGVQRALVVAADEQRQRRLAYLDTSEAIVIDRSWYRASGLRSSESHRVEFHDTPVIALLGEVGELSQEPWFSRDAVRTTATWVGLCDCIVHATLRAIEPERASETQAHGIGRMLVAHATIERWLAYAVSRLGGNDRDAEDSDQDPARLTALCRIAIADASREIAALAANTCGSRALAGGGALERARRDLDLFLLQHRLDPKITALGQAALQSEPR
ncbi:MAG TPA: acyl-CoA dehydrogenase family protein [Solirubrobacteraceae bacterium]|jgi:alkylation response protein AidB-like acyl-CoA dehydrogenase|nr:acyl-CoA dehydrogenase family protein [Solirubrobacteraceae bacterium]